MYPQDSCSVVSLLSGRFVVEWRTGETICHRYCSDQAKTIMVQLVPLRIKVVTSVLPIMKMPILF